MRLALLYSLLVIPMCAPAALTRTSTQRSAAGGGAHHSRDPLKRGALL
jgi:hypothetical protein